jgi:hypothetical protein
MTTNKKKIPNSLIITIKTRIPKYYKLTYEPEMSIPDTKSHTVFFNPLVKYYSNDVSNLPSKNLIISQFFEKGQFESMINRILSNFKHMQPERTLQQATEEGIIDNNISITLNTLFKNNNILYIGDRPYTIVSSNWNKGDWKLDAKPIEKVITPYSYLPGQPITNLYPTEQYWSEIPEVARQGNLSYENLTKTQIDSSNNIDLSLNTVKSNKIIGGESNIIHYYDPTLFEKYKPNKDESKFSYYINIELELFPGTSVNSLQKSAVKCEGQFEKIRQAYADLFGYEYRPGIIKEAYEYQSQPIKQNGGTNKKYNNKSIKNKTYKKNKKYKNIKNKTYKKNKSIKNKNKK